jgi:hypothetical protein
MIILNVLLGLTAFVAIIVNMVMWVISLIKAITREDLKNSKVLWILLIIFVAPIGSIVFFFMEGYKKYAWIYLVAALSFPILLAIYAIITFTSAELMMAG